MKRIPVSKQGQQLHDTHDAPREDFGILAFPLEIRRQIYASMTQLCQVDHLNFLCTCKRLHSEAEHSFLSRPLNLPDQEELIRFSAHRSPRALKHVQELSFHFTDIERNVMSSFLAQIMMGTSKVAFQDPYRLETSRVTHALQALPNIKSFSLTEAAKAGETSAPRVLLNSVLSWAAEHYPRLTYLRVDSPNVSLEPLRSCRSLVSLRITGLSETPAKQMTVILAGLTNLVELQIVALRGQSRYFSCRDAKSSINSESFRHVRPLRMISINDSTAINHPAFVTVSILRTIGETHSHVLRQFTISSPAPLEQTVVVQLAEIVRSMTKMHTLVLTWPGLDADFLGCLPSSTWSLELLASDEAHAMEMLDTLIAIWYRLPNLRRVHFVTPGRVPQFRIPGAERVWSSDAAPTFRSAKKLQPLWTVNWSVRQSYPDA